MTETVSSDICIRGATERDFAAVSQLCVERYGAGYMDRADFELWLKCPQLLKVALYRGEFAGFSVMTPATAESVASHMQIDVAGIKEFSAGKPTLIYKSAALVPKFERRGIMLNLLRTELELAKGLGYGAVYGSAWKYDGFVPMAKLFHATGFEIYGQRKMLWYHMEEYVCVVCGGRCRCDAVIYRKKL